MGRIWKVGTPLVMGHGVFLLCLGMALCSLGSFMTNPKVEALGYMVAVFLTAICLLGQAIVACIRVLANGTWHRREFYIYILVGLFAIACWLVFWLYRLSLQEHTVCLLCEEILANETSFPHTTDSRKVPAIQQAERAYPEEPTGRAKKPASKQ